MKLASVSFFGLLLVFPLAQILKSMLVLTYQFRRLLIFLIFFFFFPLTDETSPPFFGRRAPMLTPPLTPCTKHEDFRCRPSPPICPPPPLFPRFPSRPCCVWVILPTSKRTWFFVIANVDVPRPFFPLFPFAQDCLLGLFHPADCANLQNSLPPSGRHYRPTFKDAILNFFFDLNCDFFPFFSPHGGENFTRFLCATLMNPPRTFPINHRGRMLCRSW